MLNEKIKEKAKNGAEKVKDFWDDYGLIIGYCAVCVAIPVGMIARLGLCLTQALYFYISGGMRW